MAWYIDVANDEGQMVKRPYDGPLTPGLRVYEKVADGDNWNYDEFQVNNQGQPIKPEYRYSQGGAAVEIKNVNTGQWEPSVVDPLDPYGRQIPISEAQAKGIQYQMTPGLDTSGGGFFNQLKDAALGEGGDWGALQLFSAPVMAAYGGPLLSSLGVTNPIAQGAIKGAVSSGISGGDPLSGALSGGAGSYMSDLLSPAATATDGALQPEFASAEFSAPQNGEYDLSFLNDPAFAGGYDFNTMPTYADYYGGGFDPKLMGYPVNLANSSEYLSPGSADTGTSWYTPALKALGVGAGFGAAGAAGGGGSGATGTTGTTGTISKLLGLTGGAATAVDALGRAIPGLLGAYASSEQAGALGDMARKLDEYGAPSRARYEASFAPGFDLATADPAYKGALDTTADALSRSISARAGNPYGNPGALMEANKYLINSTAMPALNEYRRLNAGTGALANLAAAAPAASTAATGASTNIWSGLGGAAADVLNPKPAQLTLADFMKQFNTGKALA